MNVIANVIAVDDSLPMYTVTGIGFTLFIELKKKKERFYFVPSFSYSI